MAREDNASSKFSSFLSLMKEAGCPSPEKAATYSHQDSVEEIEEALIQASKECIDYDAVSQSDYIGIIILTRLLMRSLSKNIIIRKLYSPTKKEDAPFPFFLGSQCILYYFV